MWVTIAGGLSMHSSHKEAREKGGITLEGYMNISHYCGWRALPWQTRMRNHSSRLWMATRHGCNNGATRNSIQNTMSQEKENETKVQGCSLATEKNIGQLCVTAAAPTNTYPMIRLRLIWQSLSDTQSNITRRAFNPDSNCTRYSSQSCGIILNG